MASALSEAEVDILNNMKDFVFGFNKKLADIREVLSETISEAWNCDNDLLDTSLEPYDTVHITNIIHTENIPLKKVLTVFSVLMNEMKELKSIAESKFYGPLSMYGHQIEIQEDGEADEEDGKVFKEYRNRKHLSMEQEMGNFLPLLQDLANFTKRVNAVIRNTVCQLACLYHERMKLYQTTFKNVDFDYVYESLGDLCGVLVTIDSIIADNAELQDGWVAYKRMIKYIRSDPERYNANEDQLAVLEQMLMSIDERVMTNNTFSSMLAQDMTAGTNSSNGAVGATTSANIISSNLVFAQVLSDSINRIISRLRAGLNESLETYDRSKFVDIYALYALFRSLYKSTVKTDMKLYRIFWEIQQKVAIVCVYGRACWFPADFLVKYTPTDNSSMKPAPKLVIQTRKDILTDLDNTFGGVVNNFHNQVCIWMVRMEGELLANQEHNSGAQLNARSKLLIHGILLGNQIRSTVSSIINLRLALDIPFLSKNIRPLCTCIELLKAIEHTFRRRLSMISDNIQHMIGQSVYAIQKILKPLCDKLDKREGVTSKLNETKADIHAALALALDVLQFAPTTGRRVVLQLCVAVSQLKLLVKSNFEEELRFQIWKLERLTNYQDYLRKSVDCSFLYWFGNIVPVLMKDVIDSQVEHCTRLQYLFYALQDCATMLKSDNFSKERGKLLTSVYKAETRCILKNTVILPVAREIETDLRLYIHSIVLKQQGLYKQSKRDLTKILDMKPLRVFDSLISIKDKVCMFLDRTFYNLNTVALHDGSVYRKMRNLARTKYNLPLLESHLPSSAHYSDHLDVLEIMRNIHVFVARYNYNLNTQIFIERAVDQKHINVIDVEHMAASIRTHGAGIMNTTVNFTYQFLCRKMMLVSEFLYDDHIKSPLMREIRYFKQNKDELKNIYPYARVEQFMKEVRKLGISQTGHTYLDQLRQQVTEIGNALGYVRMVRSGGLRDASTTVQYIPNIESPVLLEPLVEQSQLSEECVSAASVVDRLVHSLTQRVAEGSDYFYVLIQIFGNVFITEEHIHIKAFHAILPALTISFVESMLARKEKLHKRSGKAEACFTDDGFALGSAYLLKLLQQDTDFEAMHWFDSVSAHLKQQKNKLLGIANDTTKNNRNKAMDAEHAMLNIQKVDALTAEFEFLHFAMEGSKVFFRDMQNALQSDESDEIVASANTNTTNTNTEAGPSLTEVQAPDLGFFM